MYCNECGNSLPDGAGRSPVYGSKVKVQYANNGMNDFNNGQKNDPVQNQYQNDRMGYVKIIMERILHCQGLFYQKMSNW